MGEVDLSEVERYLRIFQENPDSRVFAPLADMYRRLGRLKEAEDICREGLLRHPYYAGGKVALAHILLEGGRYDEALKEAESVVTYYPDNLLARKILIRVLGSLNQVDAARREYEALKHLAPLVAGDPELERALQGRPSVQDLPSQPLPQGVPNSFLQPLRQIQEPTQWDPSAGELTLESVSAVPRPANARQRTIPAEPPPLPSDLKPALSPALERSRRLSVLLRKKLLLESVIRRLGDVKRFS